ncbi:helix-turn-helix domain-containing protein [Erysipelatoclostridium sp. AM42-17]|nr:helix-turn-helix domain-containing protein [Erysipelatoclostridium sp. AM42-17]
MNNRNYMILKYLKEAGEYVTSKSLSALCNVSTKTILKDIKLINDDMKVTANYIEVKPSHGIKLIINNDEEFINLSDSYRSFQDYFVLSVNEREDRIKKYLIEKNDRVKSEMSAKMTK